MLLLLLFEAAEDDAGRLAREVLREIDSLRVFLDEAGVDPTNNRAEQALQFAVLWRKRSNGNRARRVTAGLSGGCPSGRRVGCENSPRYPCWRMP
jgi:hypothetical protein